MVTRFDIADGVVGRIHAYKHRASVRACVRTVGEGGEGGEGLEERALGLNGQGVVEQRQEVRDDVRHEAQLAVPRQGRAGDALDDEKCAHEVVALQGLVLLRAAPRVLQHVRQHVQGLAARVGEGGVVRQEVDRGELALLRGRRRHGRQQLDPPGAERRVVLHQLAHVLDELHRLVLVAVAVPAPAPGAGPEQPPRQRRVRLADADDQRDERLHRRLALRARVARRPPHGRRPAHAPRVHLGARQPHRGPPPVPGEAPDDLVLRPEVDRQKLHRHVEEEHVGVLLLRPPPAVDQRALQEAEDALAHGARKVVPAGLGQPAVQARIGQPLAQILLAEQGPPRQEHHGLHARVGPPALHLPAQPLQRLLDPPHRVAVRRLLLLHPPLRLAGEAPARLLRVRGLGLPLVLLPRGDRRVHPALPQHVAQQQVPLRLRGSTGRGRVAVAATAPRPRQQAVGGGERRDERHEQRRQRLVQCALLAALVLLLPRGARAELAPQLLCQELHQAQERHGARRRRVARAGGGVPTARRDERRGGRLLLLLLRWPERHEFAGEDLGLFGMFCCCGAVIVRGHERKEEYNDKTDYTLMRPSIHLVEEEEEAVRRLLPLHLELHLQWAPAAALDLPCDPLHPPHQHGGEALPDQGVRRGRHGVLLGLSPRVSCHAMHRRRE